MTDKTLRELQSSLPWTAHYHRDFRANPQTHKDFAHALLHIHKAGGKLAAIIDDAEHGGFDWDKPEKRTEVGKYIADMVICALRMANTCPDGVMDLQRLVEDRLVAKNNQLAEAKAEAEAGIDLDLMIATFSDSQQEAVQRAKLDGDVYLIPAYRDGGRLAESLVKLGLTEPARKHVLTALGRELHWKLNEA